MCGPYGIGIKERGSAAIFLFFLVLAGIPACGLVELILGSLLFNTFKHVMLGAWWVSVVSWACFIPIALCRMNVSLLLALSVAAVAFFGAFQDARNSQHFSAITACATRLESNSDIIYYGKSSDYAAAQSCYSSTEFPVLDGCYCVSNNDPGTCTEYIRNSDYKSGKTKYGPMIYYTCYETVEIFTGRMTASCVFCCFLFFCALLQILSVCLSTRKRTPGTPIVDDQLNVRETEV